MSTYRHYIELNDGKEVIKGFSSAFESPSDKSILIKETEERHYSPDSINTETGLYKFIYMDNKFVEKNLSMQKRDEKRQNTGQDG